MERKNRSRRDLLKSATVSSVARRFGHLFRQPIFWFFTAVGNGLIALGAVVFHWAEASQNPSVGGWIDSVLWAVATVTTVGYGNVVAVTPTGKIVSIVLMLVGTLFLWSYMALFVGALVAPDLAHLEKEIRELEDELDEIQKMAKAVSQK